MYICHRFQAYNFFKQTSWVGYLRQIVILIQLVTYVCTSHDSYTYSTAKPQNFTQQSLRQNGTGRQCRSKSDCSYRSRLFRVFTPASQKTTTQKAKFRPNGIEMNVRNLETFTIFGLPSFYSGRVGLAACGLNY